MRSRNLLTLVGLGLVALAPAGAKIDSNTFGGLEARAIGPAVMSGRIAALDAVAGEPLTIFVGAASGGVWRSKDGGITFDPVFDEHPQSIGAIAVDPGDPSVVWVGTGESWTRNSTSVGDGVYKSTDGGDTWKRMGLADSERIARIVVDPSDSDTVYVCATGHLWDANEERGVYKTVDGGDSWQPVLQVDQDTGCSDLSLDPEDPAILYAGMWQFRRQPWTFRSGGPGSGLYKTTDGGRTWRELSAGLPAGEKGRIAVDVAPSRPRTVYAVVEAENTALYRSDDLGEHWREVSSAFNVQVRPFYFAYVVVDPVDHERVYKPGLSLGVSEDGGKTFTQLGGSTHSDHHALWVDPSRPHHLLLGTDGGVYVSYDRGARWRMVKALPVSQFYEVSFDLETPYNVYGGLQDNGTWMGPSQAVGGVQNKHWRNIGFGDGFHAFVDPRDSDYVYVEYQGGNIRRHNKVTGETREIKPLPGADEPDYRFNWNTPIHVSPTRSGRIYVGAQFLFRSDDRGESWQKISPDLTTDDPAKQRQEESGGLTIDNSTAENHTTIITISESPLDPEVLWVGTDDGNLQVSRDGGATWRSVAGRVEGLPAGTWVSHVAAGRHDAGTAYVTFDGHRTGDMSTYVYRTTDFGDSWTSLASDDLVGFAHVVAEDTVRPELLFLGTELGLYVSLDGGAGWARFAGNLPQVPVHDLAVHPREHDLVIGTHGRGIYILDDLTPLRHLTPEVVESDFALLPSRPGQLPIPAAVQDFPGDDEFQGRNPQDGVGIAYYQRRRHLFGDLRLEIHDPDGGLIASLPAGKRKGVNRVYWSLRHKPPKMPPATSLVFQPFIFYGPLAGEGEYVVKLVRGDETHETRVSAGVDPRSPHSAEDRALQQATAMKLHRDLANLTYLVDAITELRDGARGRATDLGGSDRLGRRLEELAAELEGLRKGLVSTSEAGWLSGEELLREELGYLYGGINGYAGSPTRSQLDRFEVLHGRLEKARADFSRVAGALETLNPQLERRQLEALSVMTREAWEERQEKGGAATAGAPLTPRQIGWYQRRLPRLPWLLR